MGYRNVGGDQLDVGLGCAFGSPDLSGGGGLAVGKVVGSLAEWRRLGAEFSKDRDEDLLVRDAGPNLIDVEQD